MDPQSTTDLRDLADPLEVRSGGERLVVRRVGAGPRVVLLHGGPGLDHHLLLPLALPLEAKYEVWLPDLPGHGASREDWQKLPGLVEVRDRTARWLAGLPGGVGILGGHSLGAWLAREACRRGAVRPEALFLVSPPAGGGRDTVTRTLDESAEAIRLGAAPDPDDVSIVREEFMKFVGRETSWALSESFVQAFSLSRLRSPRAYTRIQREFRRMRRKPTPAWDADLPVLVLCGDRDATTPPSDAREVTSATSGATLQILEDAGHFPWADGSPVCADAILAFLEANA